MSLFDNYHQIQARTPLIRENTHDLLMDFFRQDDPLNELEVIFNNIYNSFYVVNFNHKYIFRVFMLLGFFQHK